MINIIGKNNIKARFNSPNKPNTNCGTKIKRDIKGVEYIDTYKYINNMIRVNKTLSTILFKESACVNKIVQYIQLNLKYNTDNIIIKPNELCTLFNEDKSNISKAIKRLKELNIITRAIDIDQFKTDVTNKYLYFVNSNYIFNGNAEELEKDWYEQYGNSDNECNSL